MVAMASLSTLSGSGSADDDAAALIFARPDASLLRDAPERADISHRFHRVKQKPLTSFTSVQATQKRLVGKTTR